MQTGVKFSSDRIAEAEADRHRIHRYDINVRRSSRGRRKKIEGILGKRWHDANNHYIQISTSRKTTSHAALLFTPRRCRMLVGCDCSQLWPFSWRTRPMARSLIVWSQMHGTWSLARHSPNTMLVPVQAISFPTPRALVPPRTHNHGKPRNDRRFTTHAQDRIGAMRILLTRLAVRRVPRASCWLAAKH